MKKSFGSKTLIYPTPVWVVAAYDKNGKPNAATVAWGGVSSSKPASVSISLRKSRYTYENLIERKAFTVNVPSAAQVKIVDYCGIISGRNEDKFARAGITAVKGDFVDAPYIKEFPMALECKLISITDVGIHNHLIGEIMDVKVEESMLDNDGMPDIHKINPIIYAPEIQGYFGVGEFLGRAFAIGKKIK